MQKRNVIQNRKGVTIVYAVVTMVALTAIASFSVDYARVQIVKTQLRAAADAAARAAAHDLPFDLSLARADAVSYAKKNLAEGQPVALDSVADIEFGKWDTTTRKFTVLPASSQSTMNAVHVTARRIKARGNAVPLILANVIGAGTCDVKAETIVMVVPQILVNQNVPATANPFLAGMPKGSVASLNNPHNSPDYAGDATTPRQSPLAIAMAINGGDSLTFDSIDGTARHDPNLPYYNADGDPSDIGHNTNYSENGISDMTAPINALVGVYLSDDAPSKNSPPPSLDYTNAPARDFTVAQPKLQQLFFIGDGLNSAGIKQQFIAPQGATRLFLATWDFFEWNNNAGYRNIRVNRPERIITVK